MSLSARTASASPHLSSPPDTRLRGRWLLIARVGWLTLAALDTVVFAASLPAYFAKSKTVCRTAVCNSNQLTPDGVQRLHSLGLSLDFFAWYALVVTCLSVVAYVTIALVIFWRASANRTALVATVAFLGFPLGFTNLINALPASWWWPAQVVNLQNNSSQFLLFYVFPDGRFVPRWTRWLWVGGMLASEAQNLFPSALLTLLVGQYVISVLVLSLVVAQLYRYWHVSTPVQRQQTKWFVLGFTVAALGYPFTVGPHRNIPSLFSEGTLPSLIDFGLTDLLFLLIPLSMGFALLRYRLWDVDVLINKALVYGLLTGLLGALYVGLIIGLESLAGLFGGQAASNPVVLVVSTLAIAALYLPVRRRIQAIIDRRFYRKKYDAEKALAAFSATLRQGTDLEQIREQLLSVVQETMQPAHVSLWLRLPERHPGDLAHRLERHDQALTELNLD